MGKNLLDKVWDAHTVRELESGQSQLFVGLHLIHEVTSPQAFAMLREAGLSVAFPDRTFATVDHIIPTDDQTRPLRDARAEIMMSALEENTRAAGIQFFGPESGHQGVVHVIGPDLGLTQPGMTIACGDSHTSTHGAFGAVAFGIGTSQVRDVLATQCLAMQRPKTRRIVVNGELVRGVYAKDVILHIIRRLGVKGGVGFAYEFAGDVFDRMTMEERMTVCNMSIEGGARCGYVNPDETTFAYLKGREYVPDGEAFERATEWWRSFASDADAVFDDEVEIPAAEITPTVTWGINPGQAVGVDEAIPLPGDFDADEKPVAEDAYEYMHWQEGDSIRGAAIDVAFIGSCTNGRIEDLREAAKVARTGTVASTVQAIV
ncbi:MAG: 3-isopropylmalate dehydratase large subunit, partial [bacterium]